jgi:hypothetical protein
MKLDRNVNGTGHGKYGLINNRRRLSVGLTKHVSAADEARFKEIEAAIAILEAHQIIEWGEPRTEGEFFVIKLRDVNARAAIDAYADSADSYGAQEYARDVAALALRAGPASPFCKKPD